MKKTSMLPKNAALEPLSFLPGKWNVEMVHAQLPEPLTWQDSFELLENAFILWHWQGKNEVPPATFVIGRNENKSDDLYSALYYDARGVSRLIHMSFENGTWRFWRDDPEFSQRFEGKVSEDGNVITGSGEASKDGGKTWKHDYSITYTRIE
jgi:hypothetical protein